jgi:hypothetical protein
MDSHVIFNPCVAVTVIVGLINLINQNINHMKYFLIAFLILLCVIEYNLTRKPENTKYKVYYEYNVFFYHNGDSIIIPCDTVYTPIK